MINNSILEIRKEKFIENPSQDNFIKLAEKIDSHKEIFDNHFFAKAISNFTTKKEGKGLLFISQLYIMLKRNAEAEYVLFCAHTIDGDNEEIIFYLFDILCRRKQLELVSTIGEKVNALTNEALYAKSLMKYCILTNKSIELDNTINTYFEKYKNDKEFVWFVFIAANHSNNHYYTYLVSKTKIQQEIFNNLSGHVEYRMKNHFVKMIVTILGEIKNDRKDG